MSMEQNESSIWITITLAEMLHGATVGTIRHFEAQVAKRTPNHKFMNKDPLAAHIQGAIGELVVAKCRDRYYFPTVNNFKEADIGENVQVRLRTKHEWEMIVRNDDNPDHIFVHVTGEGPQYRIHGWAYGRDVMLPEYRQNHGNRVESWFVPAKVLRPISIKKKGNLDDTST
jgi:hypothetical protein